ncbi:transglutaminase domain-containing protein [Microbacterium sp. VKM Ac-2870]|uniref:transglutaminase-like domain-containing protein n=1 Tax=Microbacterium sp. VKM Ac-2870 TaxID=2783825 RepID=UPI00188B8762|nr:transglutaminase-like domain-containing protein [Microbacterium sp. VKM Ac-2870]MBF4561388.1 transglutaminase domain-containing protein [Microbacterium sp. VKM Ac-2870]
MRILAGALYAATAVVFAAVAAWPIYRSASFLMLVVVASVLAAAVAGLVTWRRWSGWAAAGLLVAVVLVSGVPLAVPARTGSAAQIFEGLGDLGAGALWGWKDVLTVDLPVGSYRNLLVPALIVFLVGTASVLLLAWRTDAIAVLAVPVAIVMAVFGLLFGRTDVSAPLVIGPLVLRAPVETAVGMGVLLSGVLWLSWRTRAARLRALRRAADAGGVRLSGSARPTGAAVRRAALGTAMVAVAAVAAVAVPAVAAPSERDVLRDATGPRLEISRAVSPLSSYRASFADSRIDQELFRVSGQAPPDRVRLAVLDAYDGSVFRTDASGDPFVRLASARSAPDGTPIDADVTIGALTGLWMPSAGAVASVDFRGPRAGALSDGFYVSDSRQAAVETAAWQSGDSYRLQASVPGAPALSTITAPGGQAAVGDADATGAALIAPASLRTWVQQHATGTGGAALDGLVTLLRQRGYLSHALTGSDGGATWMRQLDGGYRFVPSASGHSLARIDDMFTALLAREADPGASASDDLVAAVGDDEQFSVAVALIARELGFPARVVVGARLTSTDPDAATCADGVCRAGDLSAWVEVRAATGQWVPVDVTPQHTQPPRREVTEQPDPQIGTSVRPDGVAEVQPQRPAQEDTAAPTDRPDSLDLRWLWTALGVTGTVLGVLLVLAGPFLAVVLAKGWRRRARRRHPQPAVRIAGGWDEYLDAATDAGRLVPAAATRTEIAGALDRPAAETLARVADEAVFSPRAIPADDADEFWRIVDDERAALASTRWRRLRAAVSLRSFVPRSFRSHFERGSRAASRPRRTA